MNTFLGYNRTIAVPLALVFLSYLVKNGLPLEFYMITKTRVTFIVPECFMDLILEPLCSNVILFKFPFIN